MQRTTGNCFFQECDGTHDYVSVGLLCLHVVIASCLPFHL